MESSNEVATAMCGMQKLIHEECQLLVGVVVQQERRLKLERQQVQELMRDLGERAKELEKEFSDRQALLDYEKNKFEEERTQMSQGTRFGDVIPLSLGGERNVDVKRGTLCQCEDSFLATMFSGRWDNQLDRDSNGRVLLDFDPDLLIRMINYLRARRAGVDPQVAPPTVPMDKVDDFQRILNYYGLDSFVKGQLVHAEQVWHWDPQKSANGNNGFVTDLREVTRSGSAGIVGTAAFSYGVHMWAVTILAGRGVALGVCTPRTNLTAGRPYDGLAVMCMTEAYPGAAAECIVMQIVPGDVLGVNLDVDAASVTFWKNGLLIGSSQIACLGAGPYLPIMGLWGHGGTTVKLISTGSCM